MGNRGELDRAMELLEESLALGREAGSTRGAAHSVWALGVTYMMGGELDRATELLEEALTLWPALPQLREKPSARPGYMGWWRS